MAFIPTRGRLLTDDEQQQGGFTPTNGVPQQTQQQEGGSVLDSIPEAPKGPGIFTRIAQGVAKPLLKTATSGLNFIEGTAKLIGGDVQGANEASTKARDFGFLGRDIRPVGVKEDGEFMNTGEFARDVVGTGVEIGSNLVGSGAAVGVGKATLKGAIWQGAKTGFKGGAVAGGMSSAGVGLQDQDKTLGQVAGATATGTVLGGAFGGLFGTTAPLASAGLRGMYRTVNPTTKSLLTSAIKPGKNLGASVKNKAGKTVQKWDEVMDSALPDIAATVTKNKARGTGVASLNNADELVEAVSQSKKEIWSEVKETIGAHANLELNGDEVADNIMSAISLRMRKENSAGIKYITNMAKAYRGKMTVEDAETVLEEVNQELSSFYNKSPQAKYQSMSDPQLLADIKLAESLRKGLDDVLERASGTTVGPLKKRYGALNEFQKQLEGRVMVARRQQPLNIPEQIQVAEGAAGALSSAARGDLVGAAGQALRPVFAAGAKAFGDMDSQIKRAFEKYMKANPVDGARIPGVGPMKGAGLSQKIDDGFTPEQEAIIDSFERNPSLNAEEKAIEESAIHRVIKEGDAIIEANAKNRGKIVNADDFRPYFLEDGYNGANAAAVQEPSSYLAKKAFTQGLENSEPLVTFTSGMSGAGKTSALKNNAAYKKAAKDSATILDSNLSSLKSAQDKMAQVMKAGKRPEIFYTYRDPVDGFVNGVVKRMLTNKAEMGRIVPAKIVANNAIGSWEVAKKLSEQGVNVRFIDNSLGDKLAAEVPLEALALKVSYPSEEELTIIFKNEAKKLLDQNIISQEQYDKFIQ